MATVPLSKILANFETSLATRMSSSATTLTLTSSTDPDGSTLSGNYLLTIDEGTSAEEHMIVTLAGTAGSSARRGLSRVNGYTEVSGNKFEHRRGATVKITDFALVQINRLLNGDDTFNAVAWTGVASITGLTTPTSGETTKAANVAYVNAVAIAGAPDASTSAKGVTKLSTAPASATEPIAVGDNDPRVPTTGENDALAGTSGTPSSTNKYVTNDDTSATAAASKVVRSNGSSKIAEGYLQTTDANMTTLTAGSTSNASALHTHYSNSMRLHTFTTNVTIAATTTETDVLTYTLPANRLGTGNVIHARVAISDFDSQAGAESLTFRWKYGSTTVATLVLDPNGARSNFTGWVDLYLYAAAATNAQEGSISLNINPAGATINTGDAIALASAYGTSAEDSTGALTNKLTAQWGTNNGSNNVVFAQGYAEIIAG